MVPLFLMPKVITYSVPGTGTRFVHQFLTDVMGYKRCTPKNFNDAHPNVWAHHHTDTNIDYLCKGPVTIISPLRDPYLSFLTRNCRCGENSYMRLRRSLPELKQIWIEHWRTLISMQDRTSVYIPVDSSRDHRELLTLVAGQLGVIHDEEMFEEMVNSWPRIGTFGDIPLKERYLRDGTLLGEKLTFLDFAVEWCRDRSVLNV